MLRVAPHSKFKPSQAASDQEKRYERDGFVVSDNSADDESDDSNGDDPSPFEELMKIDKKAQ